MKIRHVMRACILSMLFSIVSLAAFSQKKVTGTVTSSKTNQPVASASVTVKGTNVGTATDNDGKFSISVPEGKNTLVISSIGFEEQEVSVSGSNSVSVQLSDKVSSLNEIVVTGYSAQKKKDLTGAVSVVKMEDMTKQPTSSINNQLQGQAAGVTVIGSGQPGEEPQIRIRGFNTFGNNTPLYVIDGIPTQSVSDINPNDIASLQVLKDAGAASIYGSRASNGVIVITTKKRVWQSKSAI